MVISGFFKQKFYKSNSFIKHQHIKILRVLRETSYVFSDLQKLGSMHI